MRTMGPWVQTGQTKRRAGVGSFVCGVLRDRQAVIAVFIEEWSNGQVEWQITRLKLLKPTPDVWAGQA